MGSLIVSSAVMWSVLLLSGCDMVKMEQKAKYYAEEGWNKTKEYADDVKYALEKTAPLVEQEWQLLEHTHAVQGLTAAAQERITRAVAAAQSGSKVVEEKATEQLKVAIQALYAEWRKSAKPLHGSYVVPSKCLLAMAVGGGAVLISSGLVLAGLGFASEGVEAGSLAALWQSSLGDVESGSLFARLQSLGAKQLSTTENFLVDGELAIIATCFCGVVNVLCNECLVTHDDRKSPPITSFSKPVNIYE